ncbi:hypothetical protein AB0478_47135, partial [Streptomyces sp. NPDC051917]
MTQPAVQTEGVARALSLSFPAEVTGLFVVADDVLGGTFGDVAGRGDFTDTRDRIPCYGQQHARVVGEEPPPSGPPVHNQPCLSMPPYRTHRLSGSDGAPSRQANEAANRVSSVAFDRFGLKGSVRELRQLCYGELKAHRFGAQAAQHVIKRVADAYTTLR